MLLYIVDNGSWFLNDCDIKDWVFLRWELSTQVKCKVYDPWVSGIFIPLRDASTSCEGIFRQSFASSSKIIKFEVCGFGRNCSQMHCCI